MSKIRIEETDVLIIGAGGAGLRAAIAASDLGTRVLIVGKSARNKAHTVMAEGGIACALGNLDPEDNWKIHAKDTFKEGRCIGNPNMIEILCKEISDRIFELERWGAIFDRTDDGKIMQRAFGGHTYRRVCHVADRTGLEMIITLDDQVRKRKIKHFPEVLITKLLTQKNSVIGAIGIILKTGELIIFNSKAVILATGGCGRIYRRTSNSQETTGNGYALAYEVGAELMDMEMIQFHPTGMIYPSAAEGILVTESVRGEGGILLNNKMEKFMKNYDPVMMELSARDIVARAIYKEIQEGRGTERGGVYLDISHKSADFTRHKLPSMIEQFWEFAEIDITKEKMEVAPTVHYTMGGVRVDAETCASTVKGLFVAGEAGGGVHGANRLGGNSLADILVFGRRAGIAAAQFVKTETLKKPDEKQIDNEYKKISSYFKLKSGTNPFILKKRIQEIMWNDIGIERNEKLLNEALFEIKKLEKDLKRMFVSGDFKFNPSLITAIDVEKMFVVAEAIIRSALSRKESRGSHYRQDYPKQDNKNWLVNITCRKDINGKMVFSKSKIPESTGELKDVVMECLIS